MLLFYVRSTRLPSMMDRVVPRTKLPKLISDSPIDSSINMILTKEEAQACAKQCSEQGISSGWIKTEDPALKVKKLTPEEANQYYKLENRLADGQGQRA